MKFLYQCYFLIIFIITASCCEEKQTSAGDDISPSPESQTALISRLMSEGNYTEALPAAKNELGQILNDSGRYFILLLDISEVFLEMGLPDSTLKYLKIAEPLAEVHKVKEPLLIQRYYFIKGKYSNFIRDYGNAIYFLDKVLNEADNELFNRSLLALACNETGNAFFWQSKADMAEKYYNKGLDYAGADSSSKSIAVLISAGLIRLYLETGKTEKAVIHIEFCKEYLNSVTEPIHPDLFNICILLADHYFNIEQNAVLTTYYLEKASAILKRSFDKSNYRYAILYYSYGKSEAERLSYDKAITYFEEALETALEFPILYEYRFLACRWLATIYERMKNAPMAMHYCYKSMEYVNDTYCSLAYTWLILSRAAKITGDTTLALSCLAEGLSAASGNISRDNYRMKADIYFETGLTYLEKHDSSSAFRYLTEAKKELEIVSPKGTLASTVHIYLNRLYRSAGDYAKALDECQRAIIAACNNFSDSTVTSDAGITDTYLYYPLMVAYFWKADNLVSLYNMDTNNISLLKLSNICYRNVVNLLEKIISGIENRNDAFERIEYTYGYIDHVIDNTYKCYTETGNEQYSVMAFEYVEKSRILAMRMYLNTSNRNTMTGLPAMENERIKVLKTRILEIENLLGTGIAELPETEVDLLKNELARLYAENNQYAENIRDKYYNYFHLNYPVGITPDAITRKLNKKQVFLEYHMTDSFLYTFVLTKKDYRIIRQNLPSDLIADIETTRKFISNNPAVRFTENDVQTFAKASNDLYNILIQPVEKYINNKNLLISPCDELCLIPFEVLLRTPQVPDSTGLNETDYLCMHHIVTYLLSGGITELKKNRHGLLSRTVIYQPEFQRNYTAGDNKHLPGAAEEAERIQRITSGRLLRGSEAGKQEFIGNAGKFDIVHIASHITVDAVRTGSVYIHLSRPDKDAGIPADARLYSWELLKIDLNAKMVVLSGCNSGFGKLQTAAGMQSIAGGFFYAGVGTLVSSLWELPDQSASEISSEFYRQLGRLKPPSKALNKSRLKFINSNEPVKHHPYYWAGFIIHGDDRPVIMPKCLIKITATVVLMILSFIIAGKAKRYLFKSRFRLKY